MGKPEIFDPLLGPQKHLVSVVKWSKKSKIWKSVCHIPYKGGEPDGGTPETTPLLTALNFWPKITIFSLGGGFFRSLGLRGQKPGGLIRAQGPF